ncbi:MAG: HlyD family efflux transporter periplasmic adaptor subunit [Planctomycetes bacterium]|nr:HlyD family efflux transporter periplasmic adaptor subunit [Planctomycetota bacterium]
MADETEKNVLLGKKRFIILIIGVFLAGWFAKAVFSPGHDHEAAGQVKQSQTIWTCSMHPQVRQPGPGKCPFCGMALIPAGGTGDKTAGIVEFTPEAVKLMEIQTSPVERKFVSSQVKLIGKLDYDQTRIKSITAWTGGRIDRLFVDYIGMPVRQGDHMVELYSPELISAQSELLESLKSSKTVGQSSSDIIRRSVEGTLKASREKLRLLGVSEEQIKQIESTGKVLDHLTIPAPIGGVVIDKMATEGMYVQTGMAIYTIADLSRLWVIMDAYESDLAWIRFGQKVEFATDAVPGKTFSATVSFISPVLDEMTRTVKVRAVVDNPDDVLKPGMFIRGLIHAQLTRSGKVMDASLAGKYICPMHGEIVKDDAGACGICGMALVKAEDLGYQTAGQPTEAPLVIPATAPLITGRNLNRAIVYVEIAETEHPAFIGREVILGPKGGDFYVVESGLMEGEKVVVNGAFKIDSAAQIQAIPSMMTRTEK